MSWAFLVTAGWLAGHATYAAVVLVELRVKRGVWDGALVGWTVVLLGLAGAALGGVWGGAS